MRTTPGIFPRALVLIAAFTSITDLLATYRLFKFIPILSPLEPVPRAQSDSFKHSSSHNIPLIAFGVGFFRSFLAHPFDSVTALSVSQS